MKLKGRDWWADFKWAAGIVVSLIFSGIPGLGRPTSAVLEKGRDYLTESGHASPSLVKSIVGKSKFLNHDSDVIIQTYAREKIIVDKIPYCEIQNFIGKNKKCSIELSILSNSFELEPWKNDIGNQISHSGYRENIKKDHVNSNKKLIRVDDFEKLGNAFLLKIKPAFYEQQAKSNLILDYKKKISDNCDLSLRDLLNDEFKGKLPPFNEPRLANTLGIATMIFFKEEGAEVPFLAKRSRTTGVFNEAPTWHCTSSFAARWQDIDTDCPSLFENMIIRHLKLELLKEAGISADDVFDLRPLAFCRELMRAGKPQLFFAGKTNLSYDILAFNFDKARNEVIQNNERPETTSIPFVRSSGDFVTIPNILESLSNQKITSEAAAALYYSLLDRSLN